MKRLEVRKREDWQTGMEKIGFTFHSVGGTYWNEGVCYEFSAHEIDKIEEVTEQLQAMCLEAVEYVIVNNRLSELGIAPQHQELVRTSWNRRDRSIYGRFDLSFDGFSEPKLLEYNADTPTSLFESGIVQWLWLEEVFPDFDQFNSIHEKLSDVFRLLSFETDDGIPVYFSCARESDEDLVTVEYLRDIALQAGLDGRHIFIEDIGYNPDGGRFCDLEDNEIRNMFKLYPWEWLLADDFGKYIPTDDVKLYEPAWKLVLSSKGILPVLWEMFPGHPNLLQSYSNAVRLTVGYVRKPLFSREGSNVSLVRADGNVSWSSGGAYGQEGFIYQETRALPCFGDNYAVVGSWVVNGLPAGIGIREDDTPITRNTSRFVPHFFRG